jgi:enoyl-CoA hydratase/3-hydroxyacyl-CoA dehydrogenase
MSQQFGPVALSHEGDVAILTMNAPPVNSYNPVMALGLHDAYKAAEAAGAKAIVITGTGGFFMGGADLAHIQKGQQENDVRATRDMIKKGDDLFALIESGPLPSVAAINGVALGGGCELAMACNVRVGVKHLTIGLPELKLGLIPGLGGTQRMPRLMGVEKAVQLTLKSKSLKGKAALKGGLIDRMVRTPKELLPLAVQAANGLAMGAVPRREALYFDLLVKNVEHSKLVIAGAKLKLARKKGVPMAHAYLDAVLTGVTLGADVGLAHEAQLIAQCAASQVSKALIHFFFATKESPKIPDAVSVKASGFNIKTVAVLGGGTMGLGICIVYLMKGYTVYLKEINQQLLDRAVLRIADTIASFLKRRKMPPVAIEMMMRKLVPTLTYDDFQKVDLVIEAVLENVELKQRIFVDLEKACHSKTILASNTSTIDLDVIGKHTTCQDRIIGLHFFSPAHVMPLLEIIRTKNTSAACVSACLGMSKRIGKQAVVVGNCVGFTANRVFFPYGQVGVKSRSALLNHYLPMLSTTPLTHYFSFPYLTRRRVCLPTTASTRTASTRR